MSGSIYKAFISRWFGGSVSLLALPPTVFFLLFLSGCGGQGDANRLTFSGAESAENRWDQIFSLEKTIDFTFDDKTSELFSIGVFIATDSGSLFFTDYKVPAVYQADANGHIIRQIGKQGPGPGEYLLPRLLAMDENKNLFVFDMGKRRLIAYQSPDYQYLRDYRLPSLPAGLTFTRNRDVIYYLKDNLEFLLQKSDLQGKPLASGPPAPDKTLSVFASRFQMGGLQRIAENLNICNHPGEYAVIFVNDALKEVKRITADDLSAFIPGKAHFPRDLSPYDFTPAHAAWWASAKRPAKLFYLGNKVFGVQIIQFSKLSQKNFLNIHDFDGKTLAAGLETPGEGFIVYGANERIYVLEEARTENNQALPPRIACYRLKHLPR